MEFKIEQIWHDEFVLLQKLLYKKTKGFLWNKKEIEFYKWISFSELTGKTIIFKTQEEAQKYLKDWLEDRKHLNEYPKTVKYIKIEDYGK